MILVTGGTGFVGGHVVHALRAADQPVRVLARRPEKQERARAWGCEVVQGDMTDAESLRRCVQGCDVVVHLVALPPFSGDAAVDRVMIQGTQDLLAAAKDAGVARFVLMSALGTREETAALSAYNRGKWAMEVAVRGCGIPHTTFRPSFIFGPDGGMLPGLLKLGRFSPVLPVPSSRRMQPIWADDVGAFFAAAVTRDAPAEGVYELGGPDQVTWRELFERIRRRLGKRRLQVSLPTGLLRAGGSAAQLLPPFRGARGAVAMLEHEDNTTDIGPAVETFGVQPITLDEQLRRATTRG